MLKMQLSVRTLFLIITACAAAVWCVAPRIQDSFVDEKLRSNITPNFADAPLGSALASLSEDIKFRITIDSRGLAKEHVTPATPVNLLLSQPISLKSTLRLLLEPLRLGYVKQGWGIVVTSEADIPYAKTDFYWCGTLQSQSVPAGPSGVANSTNNGLTNDEVK